MSLYEGTAQYYARYRPPYPSTLISLLKEQNLLNSSYLLDIGCGTGQLAILLSDYFDKIIGVDQENEMLEEAKVIAGKNKCKNIIWLQSKVEQIPENIGKFNLITIGRAFHWMDIDILVPWIYYHLVSNGGLVIVGEKISFWEGEEDWKKVVINIVNKYVGNNRKIVKENYFNQKNKIYYNLILSNYPFTSIREYFLNETRYWNLETIKGFLYSTANCSRKMLGEHIPNFEGDIDKSLLKINSNGIFIEKSIFSVVIAKK